MEFQSGEGPLVGRTVRENGQINERCLRKVIGQAKFSYDEMHTAIVEIEGVINSRPLSYLNSGDNEEPLTPSHLLTGRRILSLPDNLTCFDLGDEEVTDESLQRRAKHLNRVLNHFWKRWSKEYLLELRDTHRRWHASKTSTPLKIGDIVVVHDEDNSRGFWKFAKVEKLLTGRDGLVREAILRVSSRNGRATILQRPLQLLYPLEVSQLGGPPDVEAATVTEEGVNVDATEDATEDTPLGLDHQEPLR